MAWESMPPRSSSAAEELESEAIALAFGATVRALRLQVGISLNELARRAGVDPFGRSPPSRRRSSIGSTHAKTAGIAARRFRFLFLRCCMRIVKPGVLSYTTGGRW